MSRDANVLKKRGSENMDDDVADIIRLALGAGATARTASWATAGRCRSTVSKPELKARLLSAISA